MVLGLIDRQPLPWTKRSCPAWFPTQGGPGVWLGTTYFWTAEDHWEHWPQVCRCLLSIISQSPSSPRTDSCSWVTRYCASSSRLCISASPRPLKSLRGRQLLLQALESHREARGLLRRSRRYFPWTLSAE